MERKQQKVVTMFEKLKLLLEGKKVISINETKQRDSICEFVVEGENKFKSKFTLFCTDLGAWISNERDDNDNFINVKEMFEVMFEHSSEEIFEHTGKRNIKHIFEAFDDSEKRVLGFKCRKCNKEFCVSIKAVKKSEYAQFFDTHEIRSKLAEVLGETYVLNVQTLKDCMSEKGCVLE
jgi:magnesium-transporting ATPase (P-type)